MFGNKRMKEQIDNAAVVADTALTMLEILEDNPDDPKILDAAIYYIGKSLRDISNILKDS